MPKLNVKIVIKTLRSFTTTCMTRFVRSPKHQPEDRDQQLLTVLGAVKKLIQDGTLIHKDDLPRHIDAEIQRQLDLGTLVLPSSIIPA